MVSITINNMPIRVEEGTTIMEAAESNGISIPHLCYLKEINEIGACRMCCVAVDGEKGLVPSCNTAVKDGMVVHTNTKEVRNAAKSNLCMILSQHDSKCSMCDRNGTCQLQALAREFDIYENYFPADIPSDHEREWPSEFPLYRDAGRCIKCMRCVQVCKKVQALSIWDLTGTGGKARIDVNQSKANSITESDCSICGQCITHCPVGALRERKDANLVQAAIDNPEITTIVQIAPAVRTAWGESQGVSPEVATVNKLAGALKAMGFDYVFDTSFSADMTIMEEGTEFLERLQAGDLKKYPMFTSCCPGWVRFIKSQYPELVSQLSTSKSPQQMFGAIIKTYYANKLGIPAEKICSVSVMPCVSKKSECDIPVMNDSGFKDVDYVLTTREVVGLLASNHITAESAPEAPFDKIMGSYTGAGVIFGATGGVMEAALRSAYYFVTGELPPVDAFNFVDAGSSRPWQEAEFDVAGTKLRIAVASGLGNADKLCQAILSDQVHYDFVEIMACPGGCAGGGGQPYRLEDIEPAATRGKVLYDIDKKMDLRYSHENPDIIALYDEFLEKPMGEKSEHLLHTDHFAWKMPTEKARSES